MNNLETKKWFVYIGDHHEGPFSVPEIQDKIISGTVQSNAYVWCEGMTDWQSMTDVPDFQSAPMEPPVSPPSLPTAAPEFAAPEPVALPVEVEVTTHPSFAALSPSREPSAVFASPTAISEGFGEVPARPDFSSRSSEERSGGSSSMRRLVVYFLLGGILCLGAWLYSRGAFEGLTSLTAATEKLRSSLISAGEKIPFLARWISPLPHLDDVAEAEMAELKAAVKEGTREAPRVALALSKENLRTPVFYIASSLPDGARFEVTVRGHGDTLLNHMEFFSATRTSVEGHLARTMPLRMKDGSPLPMGEYTISIYDLDPQPDAVATLLAPLAPHPKAGMDEVSRNAKLFATRDFFLGGEKDGAYESRLKTFHDNLKKKAADELVELKQFKATLDSQLNATRASFRKFRGANPARANRRGWTAFAANWSKLSVKLNSAADAWTPEALKNTMFYGALYQRVKNANTVVNKVHELFHQYFVGRVDLKAFDTQAAALVAEAAKQLTDVSDSVAKAEALPTTPRGMPQRTGL